MVKVFSFFYRNRLAIILLACLAAGVVFKDGLVRIVALRHPIVSEGTHKATVKKSDKTLVRETVFPDGKKVTETLTDKTVTDTHADTHRDEKPQTVSNGGLWAEAGYGIVDGRFYGGLMATYEIFEVGVDNPVALEIGPRVKAGVRLVGW